ncbi:hypothetical protein ACWD69_09060 [Micromonospora chokoriensis]
MASGRTRRTLVAAVAGGLFALGVVAPGPAAAPLPRAAQADGPTVPEPREPRPPLLSADFQGTGRYIVRDLGIDVPSSWQGRDGNSQMIVGGPDHPIWFTNLIYFNDKLKTARYVGPEILQGDQDRHVDHWRVGVVGGTTVPGEFFRFPLALGDIYVDQHDPTRWWQVLQFGLQDLFDPELDEWFTMDTFDHRPGEVTLTDRCPPPTS